MIPKWFVKMSSCWSSLVAQWVKDPVSLLWLGLLLWHGSDPWPGNFCMPWAQPKKKSHQKLEENQTNQKTPNKPMLFMAVNFENINPIIRKYIILFTYTNLKARQTFIYPLSPPSQRWGVPVYPHCYHIQDKRGNGSIRLDAKLDK